MPVGQKIGEDFTLRSLHSETDKERFAAFNTACNNDAEGATCAVLLNHHPGMSLDDFWVVESDSTGEIVSTTCLIPWTLRLANVELRAAQLEMVLTHPDYRGRGLVRAQMKHFAQVVSDRGYDLSFIWGIPYYYRQYGYTYTIEGDVREEICAWSIPPKPQPAAHGIKLRPALTSDIPDLVQFYGDMAALLDLHIQRDESYWRYLIEPAQHPVKMVEDAQTGNLLGYVTLESGSLAMGGKRTTVVENYLPDADAAWSLLCSLCETGVAQVSVQWPAHTSLVRLARAWDSRTVPGFQWLLRVPNVAALLRKLGPVLEGRLAASPWRACTRDLIINLFREAFQLRLVGGKLVDVVPLGFVDSSMGADGGDLLIPPDAFVRLLTGFRSLDRLRDAWPDIQIKDAARPLVDVVFPPMDAYLSAPFHFMGNR